ncbi:MAG: exodeoxyribonuclease III [Gammaproteobacteria bacterium]|nr:exodeoxyribonuclease III [Gammaproteobacteria bacterium]
MKVVSLNLNGIRAAARKGLYEWLPKVDADIVCLQELKAQPDQITGAPFHPPGYHSFFHAAEKKGYSGVGIYCKQLPDNVCVGLGKGFEDVDSEGRYIQADFGNLSVASLYMPSGSSKDQRQEFKIDMMSRFENKLLELADSGRQCIVCGDWNIVHKKRDIKNWRSNQKRSGFLPEERQWMDWLFNDPEPEILTEKNAESRRQPGFVDAFRMVNDEDEQYTWWSNRGQAWANNTGWRIDYQVVTENLRDKVVAGSDLIYKEERFSDHAPLILEYRI